MMDCDSQFKFTPLDGSRLVSLIFDFPETFPFIVVFFLHYLAAKQLHNDELNNNNNNNNNKMGVS